MRMLILLCGLALAACGAEDRAPASETAAPEARPETRLVVEVMPEGEPPARRRVIEELPPGITAADFAPVPAGTACAAVYGGPERARVDGTLDGRPLHAAFDRSNSCEIARWDRMAALLGPGSRDGRAPGVKAPPDQP